MQMNWRSGHTLYLFLHWKATQQVIFTMVTRQLYSTNLFLIELVTMLITSLLVLQNIKTRLTLLIITNMDGSDHMKLCIKNPRCLQKKYKMTVNKLAVDWYASKNAWLTGDIHHRIMTKFNNQMRKAGCHVLYVCDNASSHQVREYFHIKFLMLPPNATLIVQPLDQGIIHSVKRTYKKKLAEIPCVCWE